MERDVKTKAPTNDGKWKTSLLDEVDLRPFGDVARMCGDIQKEIEDQRKRRQPNG
jgi:hypothetical protein